MQATEPSKARIIGILMCAPDKHTSRYGELLVQALVDHYSDAVPWERMERNARAEGVPLAANTPASSVGKNPHRFRPSALPVPQKYSSE